MSADRLARSWILAVVFAVAAALLILSVTAPRGPGASPDSVTYLSVARSLAEGGGWVRFDGRPYVDWPPLYPMLLAVGVRAGLEPAAAARVLGALALAVTVGVLVQAVLRATGSLAWAAIAGLLAFASPSVIETCATAWSEGPFAALVTVVFGLAVRAGPAPRPRDALALGLAAGAACLTRYLGAALVASVAAWLLTLPGTGRERLRRVVLFAGVAAAGPVAWLARNAAASGTALGSRGDAAAPLLRNLEDLSGSLAASAGLEAAGAPGAWLVLGSVLGLAGLGLWSARREAPRPPAIPTLPALFVILYVLALVGLATWTPVAELRGPRFGMPVWIAFALLVGSLGAGAWQRWPGRAPRIALAAVLGAASLHGLAASAERVAEHRKHGVYGYGRAGWWDSGLVDAVRSDHPDATVLSNVPHGLSFHTGLPVDYAPRRRGFRSQAPLAGSLEQLRGRVAAEGSVPLAWFFFFSPAYGFYTPQELVSQGFCLIARGRFDDGVYFQVTDPARCSGAPGATAR